MKQLDENIKFSSVTKKHYEELMQKYKRVVNSERALEKVYNVEIESYVQKIGDMQFQNQDIYNKVKEKEKEIELIH